MSACRAAEGGVRRVCGEHVGDPDWETDLERLRSICPEFAQLWARHEVSACTPRLRRIRNPIAGELHLTVTELAVSAHPDLVLYVETPADDETRTRLHLTRREVTAR